MALIGTTDGLYEDDRRLALTGRDVAWLAPATAGGWWAVVDGGLWRGDGADWEPVAEPAGLAARCCLEIDGTVLVGTSAAHLLQLADTTLEPVEAFAEAPGRTEWFTPWGGPPDARSITAGPDAIYVNVHVGGVLRAAQPDGPWEPTLDIEADVHEVLAVDGVVLVAAARGLGITRDTGESWTFATEGLHNGYCRAVAVAGDHLLVSASDGPHGSRGALYRRPLDDDAAPLERCRDVGWVEGNIDTGWVAASGPAVACATPDGRLLTSEDAGTRWEERVGDLPAVRDVVLAGGTGG